MALYQDERLTLRARAALATLNGIASGLESVGTSSSYVATHIRLAMRDLHAELVSPHLSQEKES